MFQILPPVFLYLQTNFQNQLKLFSSDRQSPLVTTCEKSCPLEENEYLMLLFGSKKTIYCTATYLSIGLSSMVFRMMIFLIPYGKHLIIYQTIEMSMRKERDIPKIPLLAMKPCQRTPRQISFPLILVVFLMSMALL